MVQLPRCKLHHSKTPFKEETMAEKKKSSWNCMSFTLRIMGITDAIAAVIMFIALVMILVIYILIVLPFNPEIKTSANWDTMGPFLITSFVFAFINFLVFAMFAVWQCQMKTKAKKPIVAELIYILGLEGKQEPDDGPAELKKAESDLSIYGFGHTEDQKWTFAGRKPAAAGPPTRRETETSEVVSPEDKQAAEAKK